MATAAERRAARAKLRKSETTKEERVEASAAVASAPEKTLGTDDAPAQPARGRSRDVVTVCCKTPNGLILQNEELYDGYEQVFGGGNRPVKLARKVGDPIRINGNARAPGSDPDAKRVIGGYGLTYNVPKEAFETWMRNNASLDIVRLKLIFAHEDTARAEDQARDQKSLRTGLEPLNVESRKPNGTYLDPRMPNKVRKFDPDEERTDIRGG
jgi:hypothetical protein